MADNIVPSSVFRLTYTSLTERTAVTVNGRVIGNWHPVGSEGLPPGITTGVAHETTTAGFQPGDAPGLVGETMTTGPIRPVATETSERPFTPAPKPGRKR